MRVLHYSLGLPPYRSGGLTRYSTDLIKAQSEVEENISLLFPGDFRFWRKRKEIIRQNSFRKVSIYEILNPCPVPLLHGISNPVSIVNSQKLSIKNLDRFFKEVRPEIMHVHSLMGLPMELVIYLKEKGVKIIFTTHDYYGLCLKVNFIDFKGNVCTSPSDSNCAICNQNAPSSLFLRLRNSKYLLQYKGKIAIGKLPLFNVQRQSANRFPSSNRIAQFNELLNYYHGILDLVDLFHFNSTVSQLMYQKYVATAKSIVIPITHSGIKDSIQIRKIDHKHIRFGFIGNTSEYKGFPMLKKILIGLEEANIKNWSLKVWGGRISTDPDSARIIYKGRYSEEELGNVFDNIDLLIVPSVWKETFSLITIEALSFGVPVLVTSNVGAKDVIKAFNLDFIVSPSIDALDLKLKSILNEPIQLEIYNKNIKSDLFDFQSHLQKIKQLYLSAL